jgi:hypothetical protein
MISGRLTGQVPMARHHKSGIGALTAVAVLLSLSVAMRAHVSASQLPTGVGRELAVISSLNDCIQARFRDVDERFGFRRIITPGDTPHRFKPENAKEIDAVRALERAGMQVILYLTGRQVLREKPASVDLPADSAWGPIKGPVLITPADRPPAAPRPMDLWDESARAMRAFEKTDSYDFAQPGWNFTARPVRASEELCLRCHRTSARAFSVPSGDGPATLRIGDAIGVVLYGYVPVSRE